MLDDLLQIIFELIQGNMLFMTWDAGIVGTEEDYLGVVSSTFAEK